jgi:hypothetical protein
MRKYILASVMTIGILLAGCTSAPASLPSDIQRILGQEFTLPVGQTAVIKSEGLALKFEAVTADSRCPLGAQCIWAGEAKSQINLTFSTPETPSAAAVVVLTEMGGTGGNAQTTWTNKNAQYTISHKLTPYPEVGKSINAADYKLVLNISK